MQIYPAIDLKDGKCVRLRQGNFDDVTVYGSDPVAQAMEFAKAGATYIHIVDLDGAKKGAGVNQQVIKKIIETVGIPVQTGGGVRTMADIDERINNGVSRVIIGTAAVNNPELVREAVEKYGKKIAVCIDAKNGMVATHGWENVSDVSALDLCAEMAAFGVETIIYTDISKDGMMIGPNIETTAEIVEKTGINIIASGGVSTMADLENVEKIHAHGAIIGKALYQGALDLKEVIEKFEK